MLFAALWRLFPSQLPGSVYSGSMGSRPSRHHAAPAVAVRPSAAPGWRVCIRFVDGGEMQLEVSPKRTHSTHNAGWTHGTDRLLIDPQFVACVLFAECSNEPDPYFLPLWASSVQATGGVALDDLAEVGQLSCEVFEATLGKCEFIEHPHLERWGAKPRGALCAAFLTTGSCRSASWLTFRRIDLDRCPVWFSSGHWDSQPPTWCQPADLGRPKEKSRYTFYI